MQKIRRRVPVVSMNRLIAGSDLVIEAASAAVSGLVAQKSLKRGKQVLIMSVGGLPAQKGLRVLLKKSRGKLWVPSGAVAGVDGLLAAAESGIRRVRLVTRKPPDSLREAPYFRSRKFPRLHGDKPVCIFKGAALQAVKAFPQNINVAAVLSLAGTGPRKTQVEIWTARSYRTNQHEVVIESKAGKIRTVTENVPSPANPKTSALAYYSAIATLRKIFSSLRLGT